MADFAVRFNDFSGGDWGDADPAKVKANQFTGRNVAVYGTGLVGVRPGWKLMDLTGKIAQPPATYSGVVRGFDVMGNHLVIALDTKTYDIYWDLALAPGGVLPNVAPANMPAGVVSNTATAQFVTGADSAGKEFMLCDGVLAYRPTSPAGGAWVVTGPAGQKLRVFNRWGLYLVGVDLAKPWMIWFSQVDAAGPAFTTWPANNFLFVGTTEPITTLMAIFNLLYCGRVSGWWGVSGVLGTLASVRELAIGNGPLDQRAASVTTDNRVVYWPLQKSPAFWNGERVQLVDGQRMDPRETFLSATPAMVRTAPADAPPGQTITVTGGQAVMTELPMPTLVREVAPVWAALGATAGAGTSHLARRSSLPRYQSVTCPPGWTTVPMPSAQTGDDGTWTVNGAGTAFSPNTTGTFQVAVNFQLGSTNWYPDAVTALFVDGVERARAIGGRVGARLTINAGQQLDARLYNGTATNMSIFSETFTPQQSPFIQARDVPARVAGAGRVCPAAGKYDLTIRWDCANGGSSGAGVGMVLKNGVPIASALSPYDTHVELSLPNYQMALNDELSLAFMFSGNGALNVGFGAEDTISPMLKFINHDTTIVPGVLDIPADSVVVTPTERRMVMIGTDGGTSKLWHYQNSIWTRDAIPMQVAGLTPSDVRGGYQMPEHVVFATKRLFDTEPLKVWSVMHDIDRPALVSDTWASPYDQNMPKPGGGFQDLLVQGEFALARWFDGQGRQCRVRSVIVQFRKWNQGIAGEFNRITARVDSFGPYERGVQQGVEAEWKEAMTGAATDGTDDSWRFNVGEQGFGNGFQVVFTGLWGVAIREVVALVDFRTERT